MIFYENYFNGIGAAWTDSITVLEGRGCNIGTHLINKRVIFI
jgi:hypothetical protein